MKTKITKIGLLVCCVLAILAPNVSAAESIVAGEISETSAVPAEMREVMGDVREVIPSRNGSFFAIKNDNSLWAWGNNNSKQLGDPSLPSRQATPVKILDDVRDFYSFNYSSFAIKTDGSLWAWGSGQLGTGNTSEPEPVKIMDDVKSLSLGANQAFAIKNDDSLWSWGVNSNGRLGLGTNINQPTPAKVMDDIREAGVSSEFGSVTYAIKNDGSLYMWGHNLYGTLGDGSATAKYLPTKILDNVESYNRAGSSSFAIKTDGSLWGWGRNLRGELGVGDTERKLTPVKIMDDVKVVYTDNSGGTASDVASVFVVLQDGSLWAMGDNQYGQLGYGSTVDSLSPVKILENVSRAAVSRQQSVFAVGQDKTLWAWGHNAYGVVGNGSTSQQTVPTAVLGDVGAVYAIDQSTFAIKEDKTLWAWGRCLNGSLGVGLSCSRNYILPVKILSSIKSLHYNPNGSASTFVAIMEDGTLMSWGYGRGGEIGNGSYSHQYTPAFVSGTGAEIPTLISGSTQIQLSLNSDAKLNSWNKLQVTNSGDAPSNAQISYSLAPGLCEAAAVPAEGFDDLSLGDEIDATSLSASTADWCATVNYTNVYSLNLSAKMTYFAIEESNVASGEVQDDAENAGELPKTGENLVFFASLAAICGIVGAAILHRKRDFAQTK